MLNMLQHKIPKSFVFFFSASGFLLRFLQATVQHLRFDHKIFIGSLKHEGGYLAQHRTYCTNLLHLTDLCL